MESYSVTKTDKVFQVEKIPQVQVEDGGPEGEVVGEKFDIQNLNEKVSNF